MRRLIPVIALLLISAVVLLPFVWMLSASLRTQGDLLSNPMTLWPAQFTWDNYVDVWRRIPFGRQLLNTAVYAGVVTIVSVTLDSMAGYAFARLQFPGRGLLFGVVMATMMVPIYVTLVPRYLTIRSLGWLDSYPGLIVPQIVTPFGIFLTRQYYLSMSKSYEEAALIDGAGRIRVWWSIAMPMSAPVLAVLGIFGFLFAWNDFLWPLVVVTDENMRTVQLGLAMFSGRYGTQWTLLAAGSLVATLPALLAFLAGQRWLIRGITLGDIK